MRFGITGALATALYYGILYFLTEILGVWYLLSAIVAYIANITANFFIHKFWTFQNADTKKMRRQMMLYALMCIVFFLANTGSLYVLVSLMHVWYIKAQIILTLVLSAISYFLTKRIFAHETS